MRAFVIAGILASIVFSASFFAPSVGLAQNDSSPTHTGTIESPIGKVMIATGVVTVEHAIPVVAQAKLATGPNPLKVGDFVYRGDALQTNSDGKVGITFTDGTSFNLSSNARMVLNEFVYDPNGKSNSSLFSLSKGSFTFVAGAVAKTGDMKLDTPVATMGVRGTTPHVEISDDGTVKFATLIEENKTAGTGSQQDQPGSSGPQRASGGPRAPLTAAEAARYNKLFNIDVKICRNC